MKPVVAFQGERGAFSEEAAIKLLGSDIELLPCQSFEDIFEAVEQGRSQFCIAPIENSLAGSVYETYDLLLKKDLSVRAEVNLRIVHSLLALPGVRLCDVKRVYSHPVALAQCQEFLRTHRHMEKVPSYDTAGSAKLIREKGLRDAAAIAGRRAAEFYEMEILESEIEDNKANYTRFFLLSREKGIPEGANKTSIVFSMPNRPGALFKALSVFALRDIDLTRIESRPLHGRPWEYFFYIDFLGSMAEERCRNAVNHLLEIADFLKILGCYPKAV